MTAFKINGRRFLVTGGTGFLGTYLVQALTRAGAGIRIFDHRPAYPSQPSAAKISPDRAPEYLYGDIQDANMIALACRGMDGVFHLAAMPSIARGSRHAYEGVNVIGTENLLTAARRAGVQKVVYVSSSTVYGVPTRCPLSEGDVAAPKGPYSRTKLDAERLCHEAASGGLACSVIRPRVIIGAGRLGVFSLLFERVRRGQAVFIMGPGENRFQFTHVRDVVSGCLLAMEHDGCDVFNLGAEEVLGVRAEMSALIRHAGSRSRVVSLPAGMCRAALRLMSMFGIAPLVAEQFRIADKDFVLDVSKAKSVLGWRPTASNVDCLCEAFDWYVAHRAAVPDAERVGRLVRRKHSDVQGGFQVAAGR